MNRASRTAHTRAKFLTHLAVTCNVSKACKLSRLPRQTAYDWREADAEFREAWDRSLARAADLLEEEAVRRAKDGVKKPVYQGGKLVGYVREYSDTLMCFLLKGAKRDKFGDRTTVAGDPDRPLKHELADPDELIAKILGATSSATKP